MQLSNRTFIQGLSTFLRYGVKQATPYIMGESNITAAALDELSISISVFAVYTLDLISTWN